MHANLQVVDLELSRSPALLQLEDALRTLLLAERLGDERTLAQPGNLCHTYIHQVTSRHRVFPAKKG